VISIGVAPAQPAAAELDGVLDVEVEVLAGVELGVLDEVSLEVLEPFDDELSVEEVDEVVDLDPDPRLSVL
jgi:hypothetical protein